jgi:hypothetical protein
MRYRVTKTVKVNRKEGKNVEYREKLYSSGKWQISRAKAPERSGIKIDSPPNYWTVLAQPASMIQRLVNESQGIGGSVLQKRADDEWSKLWKIQCDHKRKKRRRFGDNLENMGYAQAAGKM